MVELNISSNQMHCSVCSGKLRSTVLNFGSIPLCDSVSFNKSSAIGANSYDISLLSCTSCGHIELQTKPPEDLIYSNYTYRTSLSPDLDEHFKSYCNYIISFLKDTFSNGSGIFIDIGGNDGVLAKYMHKSGYKSFIVDPSPTSIYCDNEILLYNEYLTKNTVTKFIDFNGKANIISCNNCIANIRDLQEFAACISDLLDDHGFLFIETGYIVDQIKSGALEMINHEHYHYFSISSLCQLMEQFDLHYLSHSKIPTKGGSVRLVLQKRISNHNSLDFSKIDFIDESFFDRAGTKIIKETERLARLTENGALFGFGSSAGTTILYHLLCLQDRISFIVDDNKERHGMYMPGSGLKVVTPEEWYSDSGNGCINFAWRFHSQISQKHMSFLPDEYTLTPVMLSS